ncbi:transcription-repair coupling factor [Prochlorococcus sp. MIT 1341]|uniref:transcription-repair coupling factor n=1 Tax=Prochlorococcus sp. MIT 1341 TaxID=3096221 RepID=UPI002A760F7B|nr:transcription-repair coupling factor [Prochlorococcus sp. MIT 1341]
MGITSLVNHLTKVGLTSELIQRIDREDRLIIRGGSRAVRAVTVSAIAEKIVCPVFIVLPTMEDATRWSALMNTMNIQTSMLYPTSEGSPYDDFDTINEIVWGQMQVLGNLISLHDNSNSIIITTERALQPHLPPKKDFIQSCLNINKNLSLDIQSLKQRFLDLGYERCENTDQEGTWSKRGDIIDVYPVNSELPIRVEYFGDEVERVREFDPLTQKSLDDVDSIIITPKGTNYLIANIVKQSSNSRLNQIIDNQTIESLQDGQMPKGLGKYIGYAWKKPSSLLDYLPDNTRIIIDEPNQCMAHSKSWLDHVNGHIQELSSRTKSQVNDSSKKLHFNLHKTFESCLKDVSKFPGFDTAELLEKDNRSNSFDLSAKPIPSYPNQFGRLSETISLLKQDNTNIWLLSAQPSRTVTLLEEHGCSSSFIPNTNDFYSIDYLLKDYTPVALKHGGIQDLEGFILPAWRIAVITDKEIFGQTTLNHTGYIRKRKRAQSKQVDPYKMSPGDYIVHRNHGIGKFLKIGKLSIGGEARDYLIIQYLDGTLSVAADQLGSLGKYRATNDKEPKLNKMGGTTWNSIKEKARKSIQKVAIDLIKLYAEREKVKGLAFPPDGPWQRELEDSFPYEPTSDQIKAVSEVKKDMEMEKPMDRLVCGDVGYGKTEVAIRAIFKAITSGKQVALLTPTTVLAQQHWRTIAERFAPYPIKVALLSRFRTLNEKKRVMTGLKVGDIDVVIGTHQILHKNIEFKSLGLLVVDEEQRFGVKQKEAIKIIRKNIDVLTLSATPIPRTLYMSLSGVREMSLITTPPPLRMAIKTHLSPIDSEVIRSAIRQEIDRGGQIFYVVPRVEGIAEVAEKLSKMISTMKIIVAHGQMQQGELENAMVAFNNGEADLMLCTTIIESGLDIPRVNTIIIEDSHKFGLSQLYQLRGRVGRSGIQAHAWLLYPNSSLLTPKARQRLKAIQEFSQLGSGYQLAMRDMEIRGVGNILGLAQSGQMEAIGFDLYMELLQETMAELKGHDIPKVEDTQIDLKITAFIPSDWIADNDQKLSAYKAISECRSKEDLLELARSWSDRYGALPISVLSLLDMMELKILAKACGIQRIKPSEANIIMESHMNEATCKSLKKNLPEHIQGRFVFTKGKIINAIIVRGIGRLDANQQIEQLKEWIHIIYLGIPQEDNVSLKQLEENQIKRNMNVLSIN